MLEVYEKPITTVAMRDLVTLAKPRITLLVITTTAGGLWLAPVRVDALIIGLALLGTVLIVAGANALNMYIERDVDRRMDRTRDRPLPAGRLSPRVALWFGVALSVIAVPILAIGVNAVTALLALLAHLSYVLAYTPLKQRSHWALLVGAVPGAMPPLLGWTAATGRIGAAGLVLFGILFLWQIPHFFAIAHFPPRRLCPRRTQGDAQHGRHPRHQAQHRSLPVGARRGDPVVRPARSRGPGVPVCSGVLGAVFFGWGCYGLREASGTRWARSLFAISIVYLVLLFGALVLGCRA